MKRFFAKIRKIIKRILLIDEEFLCDSCKYDWNSVCHRPERPNATECGEYSRKK